MEETDGTEAADTGSIEAVAKTLFEAPAKAPKPEKAIEAEDAPDDDSSDVIEEDGDDDGDAIDDVEDDAVEDEQDAAEEPAKFSVKVDGKEVEVTLDELRRGYSGQQKIQQNLREAAERQKQVEQVYANLQAQAQQFEALRAQAESGAGLVKPKPPSRDLLATDPIGYMEARAEFEESQAAWDQVQSTLQQHAAQRQQAAAMEARTRLADQARALVEAIPDFAVPEKAAKLKEGMAKVATSVYGFTPDEVSAISDSRTARVLHDAMRYHELMRARGTADGKATPGRQAIKPGAKRADSTTQAKARAAAAKRMKSTGSVDDVAKFLLT